jgi:hypothetical protein
MFIHFLAQLCQKMGVFANYGPYVQAGWSRPAASAIDFPGSTPPEGAGQKARRPLPDRPVITFFNTDGQKKQQWWEPFPNLEP